MVLMEETAAPSIQAAGSSHSEKLLMHACCTAEDNFNYKIGVNNSQPVTVFYYRVSNLEILASAWPNLARGRRSY